MPLIDASRFAPLDLPYRHNHDMDRLFRFLGVPTEFQSERLHQVTHSFGWQRDSEKSYGTYERGLLQDKANVLVCWFHFLCKNISVRTCPPDESFVIRDPRSMSSINGSISQADWTWLRSAYFLKWETPTQGNGGGDVVLTIFSPAGSIRDHFQHLASRSDRHKIMTDPFGLLVVVLDHMFQAISVNMTRVLHILGKVEMVRLLSVWLTKLSDS